MNSLAALCVLFLSLQAHAVTGDNTREPDRACKSDSDCVSTCGLGGVSKTWMQMNEGAFQDCEDGCQGWGQTVKCAKSKCTVFESSGKESKRCNSLKYQILIVPAHK